LVSPHGHNLFMVLFSTMVSCGEQRTWVLISNYFEAFFTNKLRFFLHMNKKLHLRLLNILTFSLPWLISLLSLSYIIEFVLFLSHCYICIHIIWYSFPKISCIYFLKFLCTLQFALTSSLYISICLHFVALIVLFGTLLGVILGTVYALR